VRASSFAVGAALGPASFAIARELARAGAMLPPTTCFAGGSTTTGAREETSR
jgi:hypothetical protein